MVHFKAITLVCYKVSSILAAGNTLWYEMKLEIRINERLEVAISVNSEDVFFVECS